MWCPSRARRIMIRCTDSAMLSQEPAQGVFKTPTHQIATVVTSQVIQDEQHTQRRVEAIQLLGCGKRVPILPAPPFWDQLRSGRTTLEDGGQFAYQPGM